MLLLGISGVTCYGCLHHSLHFHPGTHSLTSLMASVSPLESAQHILSPSLCKLISVSDPMCIFQGRFSWSLGLIEKFLLLTLLFIKHTYILIIYICNDPVNGYNHLWSVSSRTGTSFILFIIVLHAAILDPHINYRRGLLSVCWMDKCVNVTLHGYYAFKG